MGSIGSAALVLSTNATKLYAGLDAAQAKVKSFAGKVAAQPMNLAKRGVSLPFGMLAKGAGALGAVGAGLAAIALTPLPVPQPLASWGLASTGFTKGQT